MDVGYSKETQRKIEIITLLVYSIYGMGMSYIAYMYEWNTWIIVGVVTSIVVMWMLLAMQVKGYVFRCTLLGTLAHIIIAVYSLEVGSVRSVAIAYIAVVILLGLLGIPKLMWISVVTYTLLLFMDITNFRDYLWNEAYTTRVIVQYASVYLVQFVVSYFITKQKQETCQIAKDVFIFYFFSKAALFIAAADAEGSSLSLCARAFSRRYRRRRMFSFTSRFFTL